MAYHHDPFPERRPLAGNFRMPSKSYLDTGWWLEGDHDNRVHGWMNVCRSARRYHIKNLTALWQWHDEIDAKSMKELAAQDKPNIAAYIVEGGHDIMWDKIYDVDFYLIVHYKDNIKSGTFPPGMRKQRGAD